MKKKFARILMAFVMVLCVCTLSACNKDSDKNNSNQDAKVASIAIELVNDSYELVDGTINKTYGGGSYNLSGADFKVTATLEDGTKLTLPQKTETQDGYTFVSTIPAPVDGNTPIGNYTLTFGHADITQTKVINFVVAPSVELENFTYNGSTQTTIIKNASALSAQNYTATISNEEGSCSSAKDAGTYTAKVNFTYTGADAESHDAIPTQNISWTISPATVTVAVQAKTTTYGEAYAYSHSDLSATGLVGTDNLSNQSALTFVYSETQTGTYTETKPFNAGTYYVKASGLANSNYTFAYTESILTINQAELTVTVGDYTCTYGDFGSGDVTITGFVNGDTKNVVEDYYASTDVGRMRDNTFVKYEGQMFAGTYLLMARGYTARNYTFKYVPGTLTINKANLSLSLANKIDGDDCVNDKSQRKALFYGDETEYSISDITINGSLKYNDNLAEFGKFVFEYKLASEPDTAYTTTKPKNAGSYTVRFKEVEDDDSTENYHQNYNITATATATMTIHKAGVRINISDVTAEYGDDIASLKNSVTIGGVLLQHMETKGYMIVENFNDEDMPGYAIINDATLVYDDNARNIFGTYLFELGYLSYNQTEEKEEFTFIDRLDFIDDGESNKYKIRLKESYLSEIIANNPNYEFVVDEGVLKVTKKEIVLDNNNSSWKLDGNDSHATYNNDDGKWEVIIESTGANQTFTLSTDYSEALSITYKINDESTNVVKDKGYYTIIATISLTDDEHYTLSTTSVEILINVTENPFGSDDEEASPAITYTPAGGTQESKTFNEFANTGTVQEGDIFKFMLKNQSSGSSSESSTEPQIFSFIGTLNAVPHDDISEEGSSRIFARYKVYLNGEPLSAGADGYYEIRINSNSDERYFYLRIVAVYITMAENEDEEEIFSKMFILPEVQSDETPSFTLENTNGSNSKLFEVRKNKSSGEPEAITYENGKELTDLYYKLAKGQTKLNVVFDEKYINSGYYIEAVGDGIIAINSTVVTIENIKAYILYSTESRKSGLRIYDNSGRKIADIELIVWSEIKNVKFTFEEFYEMEEESKQATAEKDKTFVQVDKFTGFAGDGIANHEDFGSSGILTNIEIEFEDGYSEAYGYSYKIFEADGITEFNYTIIPALGTYKEYWIVAYKNDVEIGKSNWGYMFDVSLKDTYNQTSTYGESIIANRNDIIHTEADKFALSMECNNENIQVSSKVKLNGTSDWKDEVALSDECSLVDWKLEIIYKGKTYTFTKTFGVVKQDKTFSKTWLNGYNGEGLDKEYDEAFVYEYTEETSSTPIREEFGIMPTLLGYMCGEAFRMNYKEAEYYVTEFRNNASGFSLKFNENAPEGLSVSEREFVVLNGKPIIKFTLSNSTYIYVEFGFSGTLDKNVNVKEATITSMSDGISRDVDVSGTNATINLKTSVDVFEIEFENFSATGVLKKIKDADGTELEDSEDNIIYQGTQSLTGMFDEAGTYKLTITSSDGTTHKEITIVVTGDPVSFVEFEVVTDKTEDADAEDKKFLADIEDFEAVTTTADSNLRILYIDENDINVYGYVGKDHGFKITEAKYLTIKALNSYALNIDELYDVYGKKITIAGDQTFKVKILTDDDGNEYVTFSGSMVMYEQTMKIAIYLYLYDKVPDFAITVVADKTSNASASDFEYKNDIIEQNETTGTSTVVGDFQPDEDGNALILLAGENPGYAITTVDGKEYITIKQFESAKYKALYMLNSDSEEEDPVLVTFVDGKANIEILDNNGVKFVYLVAVVDTSGLENNLAKICIIFNDTLPEGFFGDQDEEPVDPPIEGVDKTGQEGSQGGSGSEQGGGQGGSGSGEGEQGSQTQTQWYMTVSLAGQTLKWGEDSFEGDIQWQLVDGYDALVANITSDEIEFVEDSQICASICILEALETTNSTLTLIDMGSSGEASYSIPVTETTGEPGQVDLTIRMSGTEGEETPYVTFVIKDGDNVIIQFVCYLHSTLNIND